VLISLSELISNGLVSTVNVDSNHFAERLRNSCLQLPAIRCALACWERAGQVA
jgi:hypothetical protein